MVNMKLLVWGLIVILLVPSASAFTPAYDVRDYELAVFSFSSDNTNGEVSGTFNVTTPHDFEIRNRTSFFRIDIGYTLERSGVGEQLREFTFETAQGHSCSWSTRLSSALQSSNDNKAIVCLDGAVPDGVNQFWINITTSNGANPINVAHYGITLEQTDSVIMSTPFETLTNAMALEITFLIGFVFLAIFFWAKAKDLMVQYLMSILLIVPALVWLSLYQDGGWLGNLMLAITSFLMSGYMMIRTGIDHMQSGGRVA